MRIYYKKMNYPEFTWTLKEFLVKSLEFILASRVQSPDTTPLAQEENSFLQVKVQERYHVRQTLAQVDLTSSVQVMLEVVRAVEGCHPVLLEKWEFRFDPSRPHTDPASPETLFKKVSLSLRSLFCVSLQLPASYLYHGQLSHGLHLDSEGLMTWPTRVKPRHIRRLPLFQLSSPAGTLTLHCAYLPSPPDPEIIPQSLGSRQRLISIETEETKDIPDAKVLFGSWSESEPESAPSTDSNPPFNGLCRVDQEKSGVSSCTLSQALVVEREPLGERSKDSSSDPDFPGDDLTTRKGSNPDDPVPEAAQVAVFSLNCSKQLKKGLFSSPEPITTKLTSIKQQFLGLKTAKDQLIEKQRTHPIRS